MLDGLILCVCVLQVLCSWLSNSPNYEEITKWYLGWKSMFSDTLLAQPLVKEKFNEALDIMNRAVSSGIGQSSSTAQSTLAFSMCVCAVSFSSLTLLGSVVAFMDHTQ